MFEDKLKEADSKHVILKMALGLLCNVYENIMKNGCQGESVDQSFII